MCLGQLLLLPEAFIISTWLVLTAIPSSDFIGSSGCRHHQEKYRWAWEAERITFIEKILIAQHKTRGLNLLLHVTDPNHRVAPTSKQYLSTDYRLTS